MARGLSVPTRNTGGLNQSWSPVTTDVRNMFTMYVRHRLILLYIKKVPYFKTTIPKYSWMLILHLSYYIFILSTCFTAQNRENKLVMMILINQKNGKIN